VLIPSRASTYSNNFICGDHRPLTLQARASPLEEPGGFCVLQDQFETDVSTNKNENENKTIQPWDQQPGEPDEAYIHFLTYRNYGPGRSIDKAFRSTLTSGQIAKKVSLTGHGRWGANCSRYHWVERVHAWDIANLKLAGERTVVRFVGALDLMADRILQAFENEKLKPKTWSQLENAVDLLGSFISAETVAQIRDTARGDGVVPIGHDSAGVDRNKPA
jgi:hypothetical protein